MTYRNYDVDACRNCGFREVKARVECRRCGRPRHFPPPRSESLPNTDPVGDTLRNRGSLQPRILRGRIMDLNRDPFDDGPPGGAAGIRVDGQASDEEIEKLQGRFR